MSNLYVPPALILYCILGMTALHFFLPQLNMIRFPFNLIGVLVAFSGFIVMSKARDLFKKHQTTLQIKRSSHLISEGIFSRTRNPMYGGMTIVLFGLSICSTNLLALFLPFIFLLLVRVIFIRKEEQLMVDAFGKDYLEYKKKVRRWI